MSHVSGEPAAKRTKVEATIEIWLDLYPAYDCAQVVQAVQDEIGFTGAVVTSAEALDV